MHSTPAPWRERTRPTGLSAEAAGEGGTRAYDWTEPSMSETNVRRYGWPGCRSRDSAFLLPITSGASLGMRSPEGIQSQTYVVIPRGTSDGCPSISWARFVKL